MINLGTSTATRLRDATDEFRPHGDTRWKTDYAATIDSPMAEWPDPSPSEDDDYIDTQNSSDSELDQVFSEAVNYILFDASTLLGAFRADADNLLYWKSITGRAFEFLTFQPSALFKYYARRDSESIARRVMNLFRMGENTVFEVGMSNDFSRDLESAIESYGGPFLLEVQNVILGGAASIDVAAETLRYIGNMESENHRDERRDVLEECLIGSSSLLVRDGAAVGLSYLDDPLSIEVLNAAIEKESHEELRQDLRDVLDLLEETDRERRTTQ